MNGIDVGRVQDLDIPRIVRAAAEDVKLPIYASLYAAGADLCAYLPDNTTLTIFPGQRKLVSTGLKADLPVGVEMQIRPRSGLALKYGVTVLNSPGTIDPDYKGDIGVILINHGDTPFTVHNGDRIAQAVLAPVYRAEAFIPEAGYGRERGAGGFGSTGQGAING